MKELDKIINEFYSSNSNVKAGELEHFAVKCFNLGKLHKMHKEPNKDNPYNIDYKKQTKMDF